MKGIIIYLSIIASLILTLGGGYFIIENIFNPQGLLFEAVIALGLGITLLMIVVVASTIGETILLFSSILEQTTEQTTELNKELSKNRQPQSITDIFKGLTPPGSNMTITNLDTGETASGGATLGIDAVAGINDFINNAMNQTGDGINSEKDYKNMSIKELEEFLSDAIKKDDFEAASEINAILKDKRSSGSGSGSDSDKNNSE